jgi:hypothetical protein
MHRLDLDPLAQVTGDLAQLRHVGGRYDGHAHASAHRRQQLLFQATDGEYPPA